MTDLQEVREISDPADFTESTDQKDKLQFRKCVVAITGVPLSGKTTLADILGDNSNLSVFDVDEIRAKIFGRFGLLSREIEKLQMKQAYLKNNELAELALKKGNPVLLVATYSSKESHDALIELASKNNVPLRVVNFNVDDQEILSRLDKRKMDSGTYSNISNFSAYLEVRQRMQPINWADVVQIDANPPIKIVYRELIDSLADLLTS